MARRWLARLPGSLAMIVSGCAGLGSLEVASPQGYWSYSEGVNMEVEVLCMRHDISKSTI